MCVRAHVCLGCDVAGACRPLVLSRGPRVRSSNKYNTLPSQCRYVDERTQSSATDTVSLRRWTHPVAESDDDALRRPATTCRPRCRRRLRRHRKQLWRKIVFGRRRRNLWPAGATVVRVVGRGLDGERQSLRVHHVESSTFLYRHVVDGERKWPVRRHVPRPASWWSFPPDADRHSPLTQKLRCRLSTLLLRVYSLRVLRINVKPMSDER